MDSDIYSSVPPSKMEKDRADYNNNNQNIF